MASLRREAALDSDSGEDDLVPEGPSEGSEKDHQWKCDDVSELISVAAFKQTCCELHPQFSCGQQSTAARGMEPQAVRSLEKECDPSQVLPLGGLDSIQNLTVADLPKDSPLHSLKHRDAVKDFLEKRLPCPNALRTAQPLQRPAPDEELIPMPEVVLSVIVYHPTRKRRDQEYLVLGCQRLCELRDKILCHNDFFIDKDYSEHPDSFDRKTMELGRVPFPAHSAFFFINNTFYNDLRHALSKDTSRNIIDWTNTGNRLERSPRLDHFQTADMATTRFDELSLRLGYPYLYCHHGNCEHLLIFQDLR